MFALGGGELSECDDDEGQEDGGSQEDCYNDGCDGTGPQQARCPNRKRHTFNTLASDCPVSVPWIQAKFELYLLPRPCPGSMWRPRSRR